MNATDCTRSQILRDQNATGLFMVLAEGPHDGQYITKTSAATDAMKAIRRVARGVSYFSLAMQRALEKANNANDSALRLQALMPLEKS